MKKYRFAFIGIWAIVLLWIALQEMEMLPQAFLSHTPVAVYVADFISAATSIIGIYMACKLFSIKKVKDELNADSGISALKKWNGVRLIILGAAIFPSAFIYYAMGYSSTSLYCMLIALTGSLFCWPYGKNENNKTQTP